MLALCKHALRERTAERETRGMFGCAPLRTDRAAATVLEAERLHSDHLTRTLTGAGAYCVRATAL